MYKHLFGPVLSRRLGRSLGIDLVSPKTCSLDCVYCEAGPTTRLTTQRREYVPWEEVLAETEAFLGQDNKIDFITFSGAGEPTLHSRIGDIINHIKTHHPGCRIALLTNSTLMDDPVLREELLPLDLILPSLDAVTPEAFARLNRPHEGLSVDAIVGGLITFRKAFLGQMWVEVFLAPGVNDTTADIACLRDALLKIDPDRVQLNSLDRPPVESWVKAMPESRLHDIAETLHPLPVEIIARYVGSAGSHGRFEVGTIDRVVGDALISAVKRRPCTFEDFRGMFEVHPSALRRALRILIDDGSIIPVTGERGTFYRSS